MTSQRLDKAVQLRGFCPSRSQAQQCIAEGQVEVNGVVVTTPSQSVTDDDVLVLLAPCRYVSRGGLKLEGALTDFSFNVADRVCLDIGASTGGFTDCLLQHGASHVFAIDVGRDQLVDSLKTNPQVSSFEQTHVKELPRLKLSPMPTLIVIDVSFISILKVLPHLLAFYQKQNTLPNKPKDSTPDVIDILILLKPQFEFGEVFPHSNFDGVVRDEAIRIKVLDNVIARILKHYPKFKLRSRSDSHLAGPKGNREHFAHFQYIQ